MKSNHSQKVIAAIETLKGFFKADKVAAATGLTRKQALRVLDRLTREGYLKCKTKRLPKMKGQAGLPLRDPTWIKAKGRTPQKRAVEKRKPRTMRDKIWKAVRIRTIFTQTDIVQLTGCNRHAVVDYIRILAAHGVIRKLDKSRQGRHWQLIKNNGPCRPVLSEVAKTPTSLEFAIAKAGELGRRRLQKEVGISKTTLSLVLARKYPNPEPILQKIKDKYGDKS